ncbi:MAG: hypothetical protein AB6733_12285 [Clostridiaceae bacterium]
MINNLKELANATYEALQKKKANRVKKAKKTENEVTSFRIEQMCKSNRKKKRGQC